MLGFELRSNDNWNPAFASMSTAKLPDPYPTFRRSTISESAGLLDNRYADLIAPPLDSVAKNRTGSGGANLLTIQRTDWQQAGRCAAEHRFVSGEHVVNRDLSMNEWNIGVGSQRLQHGHTDSRQDLFTGRRHKPFIAPIDHQVCCRSFVYIPVGIE